MNGYEYYNVFTEEDKIWIGFAEPGIGLVGIDLIRKGFCFLRQIKCRQGTLIRENAKPCKMRGYLTGMVIRDQDAFLAIRDVGLMKIRLDEEMTTKNASQPSHKSVNLALQLDLL